MTREADAELKIIPYKRQQSLFKFSQGFLFFLDGSSSFYFLHVFQILFLIRYFSLETKECGDAPKLCY
jgi:hypothetical protein